ncbi:hypothetical protein F2Q70_00021267 [Brassica cretica]|uniref:Uncharacterized protein n=1 Tax=Brassica cretica TaxID=69181 RepID=A0A8S9HFQ9_BRACR|nr:hypothetical protein F2Q70_00021267 [Brassica cretica]KAF2555496.1 hypothetical protein F2Q68_00014725 [Brassica cretica]
MLFLLWEKTTSSGTRRLNSLEFRNEALFWFGNWSALGRIYDITGSKGFIDMGISSNATLALIVSMLSRRRNYRVKPLKNNKHNFSTNRDEVDSNQEQHGD